MTLYKKHVFICENERDAKNALGCCASKGAKQITEHLKQKCLDAGLKGQVRINKAGCLGQCSKGVALVIYPEAQWHFNVTLENVDNIFNSMKANLDCENK
jgi:(2Fe-2S) ferredoxin